MCQRTHLFRRDRSLRPTFASTVQSCIAAFQRWARKPYHFHQLQAVDGDKLVLNHGDEASITFAGFDGEQDFDSFVIVTTGYYDPL